MQSLKSSLLDKEFIGLVCGQCNITSLRRWTLQWERISAERVKNVWIEVSMSRQRNKNEWKKAQRVDKKLKIALYVVRIVTFASLDFRSLCILRFQKKKSQANKKLRKRKIVWCRITEKGIVTSKPEWKSKEKKTNLSWLNDSNNYEIEIDSNRNRWISLKSVCQRTVFRLTLQKWKSDEHK